MNAFAAALGRELRLAIREPGEAATAAMFFVLAALLFPFGVGPEPDLLARIAAGVLWVAALLAAMLSLERLFLGDYEDGSFEVLALCPLALPLVVGAKMLAHWLTTCIPLIAASPLLALLLDLGGGGYAALVAAMALGTPTVSLVGGVGAALTLGARRGGVLLSILVLPLLIPVLIFGAAAVDAAIAGHPVRQHLMVLGAMALAASALCPWASASAVRQALE
ncbi:MAG: heme exporter protein CcmB [Defluviicoccus sp.]|nr:heme exporter protein CcmB [Defluviicoccus sp.]MDE0384682.1 heme exporter protein CcmB [Defluviicoccus sp.]